MTRRLLPGFLLLLAGCAQPTAAESEDYLHEGRPLSDWIRELRSENRAIKAGAIDTLDKMGPEARDAVPALIQAAGDEDPLVRLMAVRCLGHIGRNAKAAEPTVARAMEDPNREVSKEAIRAYHLLVKSQNP